MMAEGARDLPPVSAPNFLDRLREEVQRFLGSRGDELDTALTLRQLGERGWLNEDGTLGGGSIGPMGPTGPQGPPGDSEEPDLTPPPNVTGLDASAGISHIYVTWDAPVYTQGHGHAKTNIYGVQLDPGSPTAPTFSSATRIYEATGPLTLAAIPSDPNRRWHIWAKWETVDGVESVSPAGGLNGKIATTGQDVARLLAALSGQIRESQLFASLNQRIDLIDGPTSLAGSVAKRILDESEARIASISSVQTTLQEADASLASSITTLSATVSGNTTAIANEATARANADSAQASATSILAARMASRTNLVPNSGFESGMTGWVLNGEAWAINDNVWGRYAECVTTSAQNSLDSAEFAVQAGEWYVVTGDSLMIGPAGACHFDLVFYKASGEIVQASTHRSISASHDFSASDSNRVAHVIEVQAVGDAVKARARYVFTGNTGTAVLGARQVKAERGRLPYTPYSADTTLLGAFAAIASEQSARVTETSALAASITTLSSQVGTNTAALSTEASTRATADGYLGAQYTVRAEVSSDGRTVVGGFGLSATSAPGAGPTIDFGVVANKFYVAAPAGSGVGDVIPFVVQTTDTVVNGVTVPKGVYMDAAYIVNLTAAVARLGNAWIDNAMIAAVSAGKITAGSIDVGSYIQSPNFVSGSSGWRISGNGVAEFSGVIVRGTVYANAGVIGGVTIYNNYMQSAGYNGTSSGFRLDGSTGKLTAFDGEFGGKVTATSGAIGGAVIDSTGVQSTNYAAATAGWRLDNASGAVFAYSGKLGGWTLGQKSLSYGATSPTTGNGIWMGEDAGTVKAFIGNASGPHMRWDGTDLFINTPRFNNFSASVPGGNIVTAGPSGTYTYGSRTCSVTGGVAPYQYRWIVTMRSTSASASAVPIISGENSPTVTISGNNSGVTSVFSATCLVCDANGRTTFASFDITATHADTGE